MRDPLASMPLRTLTIAIIATCLMNGCSFVPTYGRPEAPVPDTWADGSRPRAKTVVAPQVSENLGWEDFVTEDNLAQLIRLALENNRNLRQALLNVEAARATYRIQGASRLPELQVQANSSRQRTAEAEPVQSTVQAGLGLAAFELDLFGRVRALSESAMQEYLAVGEAADAARITLVAEVITAYITRDGAQRRYHLADQTVKSRLYSLRLVELRRDRGVADELEHQNAISLVHQARVELQRIDREIRQTSNTLALLVGVSDTSDYLPAFPGVRSFVVQDIAAGTPSAVLASRPDIRAAEHQLIARNADIGAARAAFFPRISLTGFLGSSSNDLSGLLEAGGRSWSFAPQLTLPILDGGANRSNLDQARVRKDVAIAAYEESIQKAFRDVSDALAAIDTLRRQVNAQNALAQASTKSRNLSEIRYRSGVDNHLHFLDAQRTDFANQIALIDVRTERQVALATLFRSLGGQWQAPESSKPGAKAR